MWVQQPRIWKSLSCESSFFSLLMSQEKKSCFAMGYGVSPHLTWQMLDCWELGGECQWPRYDVFPTILGCSLCRVRLLSNEALL